MMFPKGLLHGMKFIIAGRQSFDGNHIGPFALSCKNGARLNGFAVEMHIAAPALGCVTAHMGPCQAQMFSNVLNKKCTVFDVRRYILAVYGHTDFCRGQGFPPFVAALIMHLSV